ncbi:MAG: hypothetical protein RBR86_08850 [Pseudobdellovibrionaceae bacterium]|nr:hypothetical protein [Pseudobdellovibrionaceae bacterium]
MRQKTAWKQFAKRHGLTYDNRSVLSSSVVGGIYRNYGLAIFSEAQMDGDSRGRKFRTIIQMELPPGMPTEGVIATQSMKEMASLLGLEHPYAPENGNWDASIYLKTQDVEKMKSYLTSQRVAALYALMTAKGLGALFIFNEKETLLRIETAEPLDQVDRLEKLINKICDTADKLLIDKKPSA